jgi:hypothetical protein
MGDEYFKMMRQNMKMSGMTDEQIEAALAMQKAAMEQAMGGMPFPGMQIPMAADIQKALESDSCFCFSEKPEVNESYQWAIACGADLIHLRADIINDLSSGNDRDLCKSMLSEEWGIDTKKDFTEMAESLKAGRHSRIYHQLAEGKDIEDFEEEKENLKEAKKLF